MIGSDCNNWLKVFVPSNGSVEQLKKTLEENNVIDLSSNFLLIHEGQEIRDDFFFDQMDMKKNSKILLAKLKMTPCKINRFPTTSNQWWYISTNMDGITFSVNKKIKLTGFGIFRSHENKTFGANIKVIEGTPTSMGNCLVEETIEIPTAPDALNNITPFNFKRPVTIKANTQYTAQLSIVSSQNNYAYTYYGSSGTATVEGEKKAEFTFTYCSGYSTSIESGLFPEFYYLC